MKYARELNAGQIHLNYGSAGSDAPFGGYKQSGMEERRLNGV